MDLTNVFTGPVHASGYRRGKDKSSYCPANDVESRGMLGMGLGAESPCAVAPPPLGSAGEPEEGGEERELAVGAVPSHPPET